MAQAVRLDFPHPIHPPSPGARRRALHHHPAGQPRGPLPRPIPRLRGVELPDSDARGGLLDACSREEDSCVVWIWTGTHGRNERC
jgi:hypothetical protein